MVLIDKNKRGQTLFFTFMLGVVILVLGLALFVVVQTFVTDARAPTTDTAVGLDCLNSSISDYQKAQCTLTDLSMPYYLIGMIGLAGMVWAAKLIIGG